VLQNAGLDEQHTVPEAEVDPPREHTVAPPFLPPHLSNGTMLIFDL
jgi:hypothetical protein